MCLQCRHGPREGGTQQNKQVRAQEQTFKECPPITFLTTVGTQFVSVGMAVRPLR
jgi:hypothetical protein